MTLTVSQVGGDLRSAIRDWIFAAGLVSEEDRGWFFSTFRVRGDDRAIDRLSSRIDTARAVLVSAEIGGMLYGRDACDVTVSTMLKMRLAAIREDVRRGRLHVAGILSDIDRIVGRRRLPPLA